MGFWPIKEREQGPIYILKLDRNTVHVFYFLNIIVWKLEQAFTLLVMFEISWMLLKKFQI